jgi:hypothetical protein
MNSKQDPRAKNARKHGLSVAARLEPAATKVIADLVIAIAGAGAQPRRMQAAARLVDRFFELRRIGAAKAALFEHAVTGVKSEQGLSLGTDWIEHHELDQYARAYGGVLPPLVKIEHYERRAASQFLSASRHYASAEEELVLK